MQDISGVEHNPAELIAELRSLVTNVRALETLVHCANAKSGSDGTALALLNATEAATDCLRKGDSPLALSSRYLEAVVIRRGGEIAHAITDGDVVLATIAQLESDPKAEMFASWMEFLTCPENHGKHLQQRNSDPDKDNANMNFRSLQSSSESNGLKVLCTVIKFCLRRVCQLKPQSTDGASFEDAAWSPYLNFASRWATATIPAMQGFEGPDLATQMRSSLGNFQKVLEPGELSTSDLKSAVGDITSRANVFAQAYTGVLAQAAVKRAGQLLVQRAKDERTEAAMQEVSSRVAQVDWTKMLSIAGDMNNSTSLKVKLSDVVNLNLDIKRIHASVSAQFLEKHAATLINVHTRLKEINDAVQTHAATKFCEDIMRQVRSLEHALEGEDSQRLNKYNSLKGYANNVKTWHSNLSPHDFTHNPTLVKAFQDIAELRKSFITKLQETV